MAASQITTQKMTVHPPSTVRGMSTDRLRRELGHAIDMTAKSVAYLAAVWTELERRGEDMSALKIGLAPYLRLVAAGKLAPEAVIAFAGQRMVLRWLGSRDLDEQRALSAGEPVTVRLPDGREKCIPLSEINAPELRYIAPPGDASTTIQDDQAPRRRGRPRSAATGETRNRTVVASLTTAEYQVVVDSAITAGLSISAYLRHRLGLDTQASATPVNTARV